MPAPALKKKPFLLFNDNPLLTKFADAFLTPDTLIDVDMPAFLLNPATGNQWFGGGNLKTHALVETNPFYHVGQAVKVHARQGSDATGYTLDNDGTIDLTAPSGSQTIDPTWGVTQARADRDKMSIDVAFTSNADGYGMSEQLFHQKGGSHLIMIDTDPTAGVNFFTLHSEWRPDLSTGSSGVVFVDEKGVVRINDNSGDINDISNSFQLRFYGDVIDGDPNTPGHQAYTGQAGDFRIVAETIAPPPIPALAGLIGIPATITELDLHLV